MLLDIETDETNPDNYTEFTETYPGQYYATITAQLLSNVGYTNMFMFIGMEWYIFAVMIDYQHKHFTTSTE
jgi:hypothetical protein